MSAELFKGKAIASLYRKYREGPPLGLIQRIISYLKEQHTGPLTQAVDLGCGSGQCSFLLAPHFKNVTSLDTSPDQIYEAQALQRNMGAEFGNVQFRVSPAEEIDLPDKSVQLITACTAAHWFDLQNVYKEGRRLLQPGGVMAFFCTQARIIELKGDPWKNEQLRIIMKDATYEMTKKYSSPPLEEMWQHKYKNISIPYRDLIREFGHGSEVTTKTSLSSILGLIKSLAATQAFFEKDANEAEKWMEELETRFLHSTDLNKEDMDKEIFAKKVLYMLVMARI